MRNLRTIILECGHIQTIATPKGVNVVGRMMGCATCKRRLIVVQEPR